MTSPNIVLIIMLSFWIINFIFMIVAINIEKKIEIKRQLKKNMTDTGNNIFFFGNMLWVCLYLRNNGIFLKLSAIIMVVIALVHIITSIGMIFVVLSYLLMAIKDNKGKFLKKEEIKFIIQQMLSISMNVCFTFIFSLSTLASVFNVYVM